MDIGKIIKEKRTERNLTQEDLAQQFFVTRQLISKWENGKSYPDLKQVVQLSELFDISLEGLLKEDTGMVKDLSFDIKQKRLFKGLILFLAVISVGVISIFSFFWWVDLTYLEKDDIEITKITKQILPEEVVVVEQTGEEITLPQDVEYTVHFKTNKWLIDLAKISGTNVTSDAEGVEIQIWGHHKLFGAKKESKAVVYSNRDKLLNEEFDSNIGKSLYMYNRKKGAQRFNPQQAKDKDKWPLIKETSDKIADVKSLEKLPVE
ncbi:helix-turn-helix domain-containing protein [Candidatus Enterococcus murrayae]|uniref:Helix-turn-helix transcriptional regulator n=1 Tax=Candidatus Enterococcus murrayae TaxID=2815321 RepID=A0ABS3HG58_9ENTE|nr:helix-turn-helix transcriptional regulator [Enterococcus sp. MJM16]MBO0452012.1 helix-turn-helix transcriptional regulator [Enterococcus sp. MJM16]